MQRYANYAATAADSPPSKDRRARTARVVDSLTSTVELSGAFLSPGNLAKVRAMRFRLAALQYHPPANRLVYIVGGGICAWCDVLANIRPRPLSTLVLFWLLIVCLAAH